MKILLFISYIIVMTAGIADGQFPTIPPLPPPPPPECARSDHGSLRLRTERNPNNALVGPVEICWCDSTIIDMPSMCLWHFICSEGWTNDRAQYTCDNVEPAYEEGTVIETTYRLRDPRLSLNISRCQEDDYTKCNDVTKQPCRMVAGVICTEREIPCDSDDQSKPPCQDRVITITHPTPSQTTPTCSITIGPSGQLGPCTTNVTALGMLAGVLIALLVAIVTGWVCTYIAMKKRIGTGLKTSQVGSDTNKLHGPLNDHMSSQQPQLVNYSYLGPAYETVELTKGVGHTYDIINRNQGGNNVQPQNLTVQTVVDRTSDHHDYHILEQSNGHDGHTVYHTLEPTKEDKQYRVLKEMPRKDDDEQDYHVLESNSSVAVSTPGRQGVSQEGRHVNIDSNPQDYEIPTPTTKPRGAGEDEEEFSRLKH